MIREESGQERKKKMDEVQVMGWTSSISTGHLKLGEGKKERWGGGYRHHYYRRLVNERCNLLQI